MFCELAFELLIPICRLHGVVILCWESHLVSALRVFFLAVEEPSKQRSAFHPRQLTVLPSFLPASLSFTRGYCLTTIF